MQDFKQIEWDATLEEDCRALVRLAVREDLERQQDWTTVALVPDDRRGAANIVAREPGIVAGVQAAQVAADEMQADMTLSPKVADGDAFQAGQVLIALEGNVRDLLTCERILLNLLGRLMGIATLAGKYVTAVNGTSTRVYDTRKTTLGWRRLEKYASRCGGVRNHRAGLFDAILIKDNHLAQRATPAGNAADAVRDAQQFLQSYDGPELTTPTIIEIEVDTLEQLATVLPAGPDIVLLDNMSLAELRESVELRNHLAPEVQLEASGGVTLETIREIAMAGVERISVGAITHAVRSLDIGLDWKST